MLGSRLARLHLVARILAASGLLATVCLTLIGSAFLLDGSLRIKTTLARGDLTLETLTDLQSGLKDMQSGFPYVKYLQALPWLGQQLEGAEMATAVSLETLEVAVTGFQLGERMFTGPVRSLAELSDDERRLFFTRLTASLPELRAMQVRLRLAQSELDALADYRLLPVLNQAIEPLRGVVPDLLSGVDVLIPLAAIAPEYAGLSDDRQLLLLFMDTQTLRPGGGVINVYGLVTLSDGQVVSLVTGDSDPILAQAAKSPVFLNTAVDATTFMKRAAIASGQPAPDIHGVLGLTPSFLARFLTLVGPMTLSGQAYTADNVGGLFSLNTKQTAESLQQLTSVLIDRILAIPFMEWPSLLRTLQDSLEEKELAFMSYDTPTQSALQDFAWAGDLPFRSNDDLILAIETNHSPAIPDDWLDRGVRYSLIRVDGGYRATTTLTYAKKPTSPWQSGVYSAYTELYAPFGAQLVSSETTRGGGAELQRHSHAPGEVMVNDKLGLTSFGVLINVDSDQLSTLTFTYALPASLTQTITRGTYSLLALQAMGAGDKTLTLDLDFDNTLKSAWPSEEREVWGDDAYQLTTWLNMDKRFTVRLR